MDRTTTHKAILGLIVYKEKPSNIEIILGKINLTPTKILESLPEYCIFDGYICYTVDVFDDLLPSEYITFIDFRTIDNVIDMEIGNVGFEGFYKELLLGKYLDDLEYTNIGSIHPPIVNHLIIKFDYIESYDHYSGGYEYDVEYEVIGKLNKDFEMIKL